MPLEKNFSRWISVRQLQKRGRCKLQAPIKGRNFGAKLTHHCGLWLDISFFSHVKNHRTRFWLDVSFFFTYEKYRSLLWLARTRLCLKLYDIASLWEYLSMYVNNIIYKITKRSIKPIFKISFNTSYSMSRGTQRPICCKMYYYTPINENKCY